MINELVIMFEFDLSQTGYWELSFTFEKTKPQNIRVYIVLILFIFYFIYKLYIFVNSFVILYGLLRNKDIYMYIYF